MITLHFATEMKSVKANKSSVVPDRPKTHNGVNRVFSSGTVVLPITFLQNSYIRGTAGLIIAETCYQLELQ